MLSEAGHWSGDGCCPWPLSLCAGSSSALAPLAHYIHSAIRVGRSQDCDQSQSVTATQWPTGAGQAGPTNRPTFLESISRASPAPEPEPRPTSDMRIREPETGNSGNVGFIVIRELISTLFSDPASPEKSWDFHMTQMTHTHMPILISYILNELLLFKERIKPLEDPLKTP